MEKHSNPSIAIIGGGLAGSVCAYQLASQGIPVVLFDKENKKSRKICGEYLCPSAVNLINQIFKNKDSPIESFKPVNGMKIFTAKDSQLRTCFPLSKQGLSTHGVSVVRSVFDEKLIRLAKQAGTKVLRNQRIKSITKTNNQWELTSHTNETFKFDVIIGADGKNSFTANKLNLIKETTSNRVALHILLHSQALPERLGEMHLFNDGAYIGVNPVQNNEFNISLVCDASKIIQQNGALNTLQYYLDQSKDLKKRFNKIPETTKVTSTFPVKFEVKSFAGEGYALIGDAGGFYDPLTGEGMYYAIWSGFELSQQILSSKEITLDSVNKAIIKYGLNRKNVLREKKYLLVFFQWVIKHPLICQLIFWFLNHKQIRGDIFVGIIGNIYAPIEGVKIAHENIFQKGYSLWQMK